MNDFLQLALAHNSWANRELLAFCSGLDPDLLEKRAPENLRSVRETLAHLLAAEQRYLRLLGHPLAGPAVLESDDPSLDQLQEVASRLAAAWEQVTAAGVDLERELSGPRGTARAGVVLVQAVHHGSDHRSQVCTTLGALGVEPPELDAWAYGTSRGWVQLAPTHST